MSLVAFSALCLIALLTCAAASAGLHNPNAIKFGPAAASASPDVLPPMDIGEQNLAIDTAQVSFITSSYGSLVVFFFLLVVHYVMLTLFC